MHHRQSILIVDDYDLIRTYLRRILQAAGYEVFEASNGRQAIKWLGENAADLVITDLIMPEQEGLETIQFLRSERPDSKIIAMSGTAEGQYLPLAEKLGAHITKPLQGEKVLEAVRKLLG